MNFRDRKEAGGLLAEVLAERNYENPIIFALPRGGVPVGYEVAKKLKAPLKVVVTRKLGVPGFEELGFGAIAPEGVLVVDETMVDQFGFDHETIQAVKTKEEKELLRRSKEYKAAVKPQDLSKNVVIIVDDGIATGSTIIAAARFLRKFSPKELIVAVPVCPFEAINVIKKEATDFVCISPENYFAGVGQFYEHFEQIGDDEVKRLLKIKN